MRLDIFGKLSTMKANAAAQGSLLHVIAQLGERHCAEALTLSSHWVAVYAAAEVPWRQLSGDVAQLAQQVNRLANELAQLRDGPDNVGLDQQKEDGRGPVVAPLRRRLQTFLDSARPRLLDVQQTLKDTETRIEQIFARFGEASKGGGADGEDGVRRLWTTLADFGRALSVAVEDNKAKRLAAEKAQRLAEEEAARSQAKHQHQHQQAPASAAAAAPSAAPSAAKKNNNLFGNFHSAQAAASATDLVAEFKSKLAKQLQAR